MDQGQGLAKEKIATGIESLGRGFAEQLDRFEKNNSRISSIASRLQEEQTEKDRVSESKPHAGGHMGQLGALLDKLRDLNYYYEEKLSKLEAII